MLRLLTIRILVAALILATIPATGLGQDIRARGRVHALGSFELRLPPGEALSAVVVAVGDLVEIGDTLAVKEALDLEIRLNDLRGRILELSRGMPTDAEVSLSHARRGQDYGRRRSALRALLDTSDDPEKARRIADDIRILDLSEEAEIQREQRDLEFRQQQLDLMEAAATLIEKKIAMCAILSPVRGTVTAMTCQAGLQRGDGGVITVRSLGGLQVRCEVPQNAIGLIEAGQPALLTPDFMDEVTLTGHVREAGLEGRINEEGFVFFPVVVSIDGEAGPLIPGMTISVVIRGGSP